MTKIKVFDKPQVYCSVCGTRFEAQGKEHICPECKAKQKAAQRERAKERRREARAEGKGGIFMQVTPAFRDWVKAQAKEKSITMAEFCDTLIV
jgi:hypothetical protein